jgi:phosphoenolpyruvate-protein kinase (PTS system EI component)
MTTERVPDRGSPLVEGIAIGRAVVWRSEPAPQEVSRTAVQERARVSRAIVRATRGVEELVRLLGAAEAELFEPELEILKELEPLLLARVDAGVRAEDAVIEATSRVSTDLLADARARLMDGLGYAERSVESLLGGRDGDRVLVTEALTPSVVASLPARVVGIVAASEEAESATGYMSHAVILARGRDIPLAFVAANVARAIRNDDLVVLDTTVTPASIWVAPDESIAREAHDRREARMLMRAEEESRVAAPLSHLRLEVHVNVGSRHERFPASADGIGLLRTELVFSEHTSAPSEGEQYAALLAIASPLGKAPVVVRLFDAGGDKPLPWLRAPSEAHGARGIELLFRYPALLDVQLRAIMHAADHVNVRVLLPLVNSAGDVERVRARSQGKLLVGAMIETPSAVEEIDAIAAVADFISIGTNDLFASVTGQRRADCTLSLDTRALGMVERIVTAAHDHGRKVSVCGELAGDPHSARILVGLGVDAISVAAVRFAKVKFSLRDVTMEDCRAVAREAMR